MCESPDGCHAVIVAIWGHMTMTTNLKESNQSARLSPVYLRLQPVFFSDCHGLAGRSKAATRLFSECHDVDLDMDLDMDLGTDLDLDLAMGLDKDLDMYLDMGPDMDLDMDLAMDLDMDQVMDMI